MFDTLADRIKHDDGTPAKASERMARWAIAIGVSVALFGGLYLIVQHM
jgi:hypothetical protein